MGEALAALRALRLPLCRDEFELQAQVAGALRRAGLDFAKEARLAPRCRADFLLRGGVLIEVKRGRVDRARLLQQLRRYAAQEAVTSLIVVTERTVALPREVCGKRCAVVALNRLWGVAIG